MKLLLFILIFNFTYAQATELTIEPSQYTLLPDDEDVVSEDTEEHVPFILAPEERINETVIFEDIPLIFRPEE